MNKGLHRFTLLVTFATLILIMAGALVTSNDAALAVPDWPLSFGKLMPEMVGNVFFEHGHRMIASTVGFLVILLNVYLWWKEPRKWVRRFGLLALGVVILQGLLGGVTVLLMIKPAVSTAHACLAQLFFCLMVSLSLFTSKGWWREHERVNEGDGSPLPVWFAAATVAVFVQLILGATLRHAATWDQHLPTELVVAHAIGASVVALVLGSAVVTMLRRHGNVSYLARPARFVAVLLTIQIFLGLATYVARLQSPLDPQPLPHMVYVTVAHVATGALVLATTLVLTLRAFRLLSRRQLSFARGEKLKIEELNVQAG